MPQKYKPCRGLYRIRAKSTTALVSQDAEKYKGLVQATGLRVTTMNAVIVLTTVGAAFDVTGLARTLVDERLAACVSVLPPMQSLYRWQGQVQVDDERQIVIKTTADRVEALRLRLGALHPYDLPEFLVIDVASGSSAYLDWLRQATSPT